MAAALAACASGGGASSSIGPSGVTQSTVRVDGGTATSRYESQLTRDDRAATTNLAVGADRAFAVLPNVYEQVGLKVNTAVSDTRTVGVNGAHVRRVGKDPLSRFLSCGSDATGTPLADSYSVTLTVLSSVTPSGTAGSVLATQVLGVAQPIATSGTSVTCSSTGVLEDRIAKTAALRTAG